MPYSERCIIILPGNSILCSLYLSHLHLFLAHGECTLMCRMVQTDFFISHLKPRIKQIIHCCKICTILKKIMLSNNVPTASRRMEFFFTISYHRYRFCRAFRTKGLVTPDICLHKGLYVCIHLLCNQSNTSGSMFRFVNTCVPSSICSFRGEAWASTKDCFG